MSNTQVVVATDQKALRKFLENPVVLTQIGKAMSGGKPDRLVCQALTLTYQNADLLKCSQVSIVMGIMRAAEMNLQLSGPLGHAYLVPRWNKHSGCHEATFQVGWKGLILLAYRSGNVASFTVRRVYENDAFDVVYGVNQNLIHNPAKGDRGPITGYYTVVRLKGGGFDFEYMTRAEAQAHRERYRGGKTWGSDFDAMAEKTVVRILCRRLSLCPEAQAQAMQEEYEEQDIYVAPRVDHKEQSEALLLMDNTPPPVQQEFDGGPDPQE